MYYYDLKEFARYFAPDLLIDLEFGDVIEVPKMPSIVRIGHSPATTATASCSS